MSTQRLQRSLRSRAMEFLQKFGRGLMLPISVLPFAGILLGIGGAIGANVSSEVGLTIANIFKCMSEVVFANLPIAFCITVTITFTAESGSAAFMSVIGYLVFTSSQTPFIHFDSDGNFQDILWFHNQSSLSSLVGKNLGIISLQTSLFGGILIGLLVAWIYNKFKYIELPNWIGFFSGIRFLPFLIIPIAFITAFGFVLFWPWIGLGINWAGEKIALAPLGVDGLVYGIFTRALMPFGLHQIVIAIAYQTPFGGVLDFSSLENALSLEKISATDFAVISQNWNQLNALNQIVGDQNIWNFINSIPLNRVSDVPIFKWFHDELGINAGRFTQDYPTYLGLCVGIGVALILASDKDKRKATISVIGSATVVAFLTGITEPLEFTFLFVSPILYYAVYVPFSGLSYMFMELVGAHVGVGFARGFIDLIIYGALPVAKGTRFYWALIFALIEGFAIFVIFYFSIRKWNIATPGRNGNEIVTITKNSYKKLIQDKKQKTDQRLTDVLEAIGGKANIISVTACATRLRMVVNDVSKINDFELKKLGASGVIKKEKNIQVIFGGEAVVLAEKINNM